MYFWKPGQKVEESLQKRASYLSDIPLHQLRSNDSDKAGGGAVGDGSGTQRFARPWRTVQQNSLGWLNAQIYIPLRLENLYKWHIRST